MTVFQPTFKAGRAWLVVIVQIIALVAFGTIMFKAMTTLNLMIVYFNLDYTFYGALTGAMGLLGLVSAIPGGLLMGKIGAANLGKTCIALGCIGSILPTIYLLVCLRASDFVAFTLLGIPATLGLGCIQVANNTMITCWFPPKKRPLPMALNGIFVPLAMLGVLLISSPLIGMASTDGWSAEQIAMCFGQSPDGFVTVTVGFTLFFVVAFVLALLFIKNPPHDYSWLGVNGATEQTGGGQQEFSEGKSHEGFTNLGVWMVILMWLCYTWASATFGTYWPTYIESDASLGGFGIAPETANLFSSGSTYSMIIMAFVVGFILTKIPRDRWWVLLAVIIVFVVFNNCFLFAIPSTEWFIPILVIYGCTMELYPTVAYTLIPEFVDSPKALGTALALLMTVTSAFSTLISTVNGIIVDNMVYVEGGTWNAMAIPMWICAVGAVIVGALLIILWRRRWALLKERAASIVAYNEASKDLETSEA